MRAWVTWSVLYAGTPVLFASACFALRFREREAADIAFGWNLLGAVAGGLLEFFSMLVGFKALLLVAMAAYAASLVGFRSRPGALARVPIRVSAAAAAD